MGTNEQSRRTDADYRQGHWRRTAGAYSQGRRRRSILQHCSQRGRGAFRREGWDNDRPGAYIPADYDQHHGMQTGKKARNTF